MSLTETSTTGLIIRAQSGFFTVQTDDGEVTCQLRGRLKQGKRVGDIAAIGDRVNISVLPDGSGMIDEIEERSHALVRLDPRPQGVYQQVIIANLDQMLFVYACANPTPKLRMLDRFLVIAEKQGIPPIIVANKVDLVGQNEAEKIFGRYAEIGYPILYTSVKQTMGIDELHERLRGKLTGLAGPSGVGKSSLLNTMQPGLGLAVSEISHAINKGRHTTVMRQLIPLADGGYIADTPGIKALALWDTEPEEIDAYFPELAPLVAECQFSDCSHTHEPGCAVQTALKAGKIHPERFESYLRLRGGEE